MGLRKSYISIQNSKLIPSSAWIWGGTKIAAAVVDVGSGTVLARASIPTEAHAGPDAVLARMAELILSVGRAAGLALSRSARWAWACRGRSIRRLAKRSFY